MDLNKHVIKDDDSDNKPFHSSGYAEVANSGNIGSVANISFEQRQHIERNRRTVAPYKYSAIGISRGVPRANRYVKPESNVAPNDNNSSLQQYNSTTPINRKFTEPGGRGYNPYA